MFCSKCGTQLPDSARFCTRCGATISESRARLATGGAAQRQAPPIQPAGPVAGPTRSASYHQSGSARPELGGPARRIATNRGLIKYILLSILTFGIYAAYFVYKMAQDMNTMCEDDDQRTGGLVAFVLLSLVTFGIYGIYWWYKIADRVYLNAPRYGIAVAEKGSNFLLWILIGFLTIGIASLVGYYNVIKNVNALAAAYNRTHGF